MRWSSMWFDRGRQCPTALSKHHRCSPPLNPSALPKPAYIASIKTPRLHPLAVASSGRAILLHSHACCSCSYPPRGCLNSRTTANMPATVYNAPDPITAIQGRSVFLSGSVVAGYDWRSELIRELAPHAVTVFNPLRRDWDSTWKNSKTDPRFSAQVQWELDAQERADVLAVLLEPRSPSPISLLEMGLSFRTPGKVVVVCCLDGFDRKGNVEIVCERYNIPLVETFDAFVKRVTDELKRLGT